MPILTEDLRQASARKPPNISAGRLPNLDRARPHAPAWFTPGGDPIRRDASGALARAEGEVEPDRQGEPTWPLVRQEP
jgi:hypothetical protein